MSDVPHATLHFAVVDFDVFSCYQLLGEVIPQLILTLQATISFLELSHPRSRGTVLLLPFTVCAPLPCYYP